MRSADEGGLTVSGRRRREAVRVQAAELFEQKLKPPEIARRLQKSRKSAYQWHQLRQVAVPTGSSSSMPSRHSDPRRDRAKSRRDKPHAEGVPLAERHPF
ncbi:helix-turn-helix domain-containing protein [Streptomyces rubradiris]|uniref:helix-turn-helix domain-containing protein n=1 Tax=Streptomyces rubradiris TaxID=285531 RepID=UPI0036E6B495